MEFLTDAQSLYKLPNINVAFDIEGELVTVVWFKKKLDGTISIIHQEQVPCGDVQYRNGLNKSLWLTKGMC